MKRRERASVARLVKEKNEVDQEQQKEPPFSIKSLTCKVLDSAGGEMRRVQHT
jgi:hypothetical protein